MGEICSLKLKAAKPCGQAVPTENQTTLEQNKENMVLGGNANQYFYLNKIKELEQKNEVNQKEIQLLKEKQKKMQEQI